MIGLITIALVVLLLVGTALFLAGPCLIELLIEAYDDWADIIQNIRDRRANR